jgi:hypothetical protein
VAHAPVREPDFGLGHKGVTGSGDSMRLAKELVDIALLCGIECRETAIKAVASLIEPLLPNRE